MSSTNRKKLLLNTVSVNLGCSCRRPKLSSIFNPKPKTKTPKYQKHHNFSNSNSSTSSTNWDKTPYEYPSEYPTTSTFFSPYMDTTTTTTTTTTSSSSASASSSHHPSSASDGFGRVGPKSVAVEKESSDPYLDFRQSMLQMIVENEIYSEDDLKELLNCFLQLNAPSLHGVIIRVFTEIWNSFFFSRRPDFSSPRSYVRAKSYEI